MKFEVYVPDDFIDTTLRYEENLKPHNLRSPENLMAKILFEYFTNFKEFDGRLDEPYVRRVKS